MSFVYLWTVFIILFNDIRLVKTRECGVNRNQQLDSFQSTILEQHNAARAKHEDTEQLCWSQSIAVDAQTHANYLTDPDQNPKGTLKRSNYLYGENMYKEAIILGTPTPGSMAESAVLTWYTEETKYNYNFDIGVYSGSVRRASAHLYSTKGFTQLIWKSSREIGCAYSVRDSHYFVVVCMYTPEGNKGSKSVYHENVNKKITCEPPSIRYGKLLQSGPFLVNQRVAVRCNPGFSLDGSRHGTCQRNKTWLFEEEPKCTGCVVRPITNGKADRNISSVVPDQETVMYSCNAGFNHDLAPRVLQCDGNDFVHPVPRCRKEGHCLRPKFANGIAYARTLDDGYELNEPWDDSIPEGHNVSIICEEGYELIGNYTAVCRGETFDVPIATCNLCYIKDVKSIYNRYINVFTGEKHDRPPLCFGPDAKAISSSTTPYLGVVCVFVSLLATRLLVLDT